MNIRTKKIIYNLLSKSNLDLMKLANEFNVSERSIKNDIDELNDYLQSINLSLIELDNNKKFKFNSIDIEKALNSINLLSSQVYKLSTEERVYKIIEELINSTSHLNIVKLAEGLDVSVSTINNDLKKVNTFLKKYDLSYISEAYTGIYLDTTEKNKRIILLEILNEMNLLYRSSDITNESMLNSMSNDRISSIIATLEKEKHVLLTDKSFDKLRNYLNILSHRLRNNFIVEDATPNNKYTDNASYLLNLFSTEFNIQIPISEVNVLSNFLSSLRYIKSSNSGNEIIKVQFYLSHFIEYLTKYLNYDFNDDHLFFSRLAGHVEFMLDRKIQHVVDKDLLSQTAIENPDVENAVNASIHILEDLVQREIEELEKAYIILHICSAKERRKVKDSSLNVLLISDLGIASNQLLVEKLKNNFDFNIIDILPYHSFITLDNFDDIDLLISTVHLKDKPIAGVKIDSNFNESDYLRIQDSLKSVKSKKTNSKIPQNDLALISEIKTLVNAYEFKEKNDLINKIENLVINKHVLIEEDKKPKLSKLLRPDFIEFDVTATSWQESIKISSNILIENGYINENYVNAMIDKILTDGPYMVISPGFIVPHAGVFDGGIKTAFSLTKLKNPLDFNSPFGDIKYVCCLSVNDTETHLAAFLSLVNLLQNKEFKSEMDKCITANQLHNLIIKYE